MDEKRSLRALLVEDDEQDVAIFRRYGESLRDVSLEVVCVTDSRDALKCLTGGGFDLVFIDLNLGGPGTGMDLLHRFRREGMHTPAIVVTGSGDVEKAVDAMKAGAYDYIAKEQLSADLLERTIRNVLERHMLEQEREWMIAELAELSVTDDLTGLANRRRLDERLKEEVLRSERTGHVFTLLMVDLDHFKRVNDQHGHQAGDHVLKQCAAALKKSVRDMDFVARFGGEEFCVLLPETPPNRGAELAERMREAVMSLPAPVPTISVGAAYWEPRVPADEIIRRADEALYRAKESGRDRVVQYGERDAVSG